MYSQFYPPDETEMLMRSESMPEALRVGAFGPIRKHLFRGATVERGGKSAIVFDSIQAGEGLHKNIPSKVLSGCYISRSPQAQGVNSSRVRLEESQKRLPFAFLRASAECGSQVRSLQVAPPNLQAFTA